MSVVVTKVAGGIGNQLFQYIAGESLARRLGLAHTVDITSYENYSYTSVYELSKIMPDLRVGNIPDPMDKKIYMVDEISGVNLNSISAVPPDCAAIVLNGYWQNESFLNPDLIDRFFNVLQK